MSTTIIELVFSDRQQSRQAVHSMNFLYCQGDDNVRLNCCLNQYYLEQKAYVMLELDNIDRMLLGILRENARESVSAISKQLNVSRATVQNRINKLEQSGVITGYTTLVSSAGNDSIATVRALMNIEITSASAPKLKQQLLSEPAVCAIHTTNGRWDMVIELQASSLESFDKALGKIREIPEVSASETSILLSSYRTKTPEI